MDIALKYCRGMSISRLTITPGCWQYQYHLHRTTKPFLIMLWSAEAGILNRIVFTTHYIVHGLPIIWSLVTNCLSYTVQKWRYRLELVTCYSLRNLPCWELDELRVPAARPLAALVRPARCLSCLSWSRLSPRCISRPLNRQLQVDCEGLRGKERNQECSKKLHGKSK